MEYLWWGLVFFAGAFVGSFLNVCIYRIPKGESVVFQSSYCPSCLHRIAFRDLVPFISYIILKGKCRYCRGEISKQYPVVELFTGVLFVLAVLKYGISLDALRSAVLFSILIAASVIDLKHKIIPNKLNLAGVLLGIPFIFQTREVFFSSVIGFFTGGVLLLIIAIISRGGMGGGDIKLASVIGLFLGWKYLLVGLFLAFLTGGVTGILMVLLKRKSIKDAVPFGPFLSLGAITAALAGDTIIFWYTRNYL